MQVKCGLAYFLSTYQLVAIAELNAIGLALELCGDRVDVHNNPEKNLM